MRLDAVIADITSRRAAEVALRESEERFQQFMDHSPALAWMKDESGRYVYFNRSSVQRLQMRVEDWLGHTDFELWPQDVAQQFVEHDRAVLDSGRSLEIIEVVPDRQGGARHYQVFKFPVQDRTGKRYVGGMAIDVTDRQRAESALREQQSLLRNIIAHIPCAVFWKDGSSVYLGCNEQSARDLGLGKP